MSTICKKEIRAYLTSMSGYVFIAFMLLVTGIYFTAYHMNMAYPIFGYKLYFPDRDTDPDHESSGRRAASENRPAASDFSTVCDGDCGWKIPRNGCHFRYSGIDYLPVSADHESLR